ncbi:hypothetical protein [Hymenobacter nivis]|uniref:hypothetical protein n=1 Tax=Hymenobacter nivis TaxID=1850093 RepID=UPI0034DB52B6
MPALAALLHVSSGTVHTWFNRWEAGARRAWPPSKARAGPPSCRPPTGSGWRPPCGPTASNSRK